MGDFQTGNLPARVGMVVHPVFVPNPAPRHAAGQIYARAHRALVQVGPPVRHPGRQADHRLHRHATEHYRADVGHALVAHAFENRVEIDPVLDQRAIGQATQAVHAAEDVGNVVSQLVFSGQAAVGLAVASVDLAGDDQDALAPAAMGRLDDEFLVRRQQFRQPVDLVFDFDHRVQLRHADAGSDGQLLGAPLVVHQREIPARIVQQNEVRVALVQPQDAQFAQAPPRKQTIAPVHGGGSSGSCRNAERKRHNSVSR